MKYVTFSTKELIGNNKKYIVSCEDSEQALNVIYDIFSLAGANNPRERKTFDKNRISLSYKDYLSYKWYTS